MCARKSDMLTDVAPISYRTVIIIRRPDDAR